MQPMLWLEEADHAFARRSEEGWEKIGHVVTPTFIICCLYKERKNNPPPEQSCTLRSLVQYSDETSLCHWSDMGLDVKQRPCGMRN